MSKWIKVEDKMPNEGEIVMTYGAGAANTKFCQAYYRANGFWQELDECGDFLDDKPTHWMALPPEPKERVGMKGKKHTAEAIEKIRIKQTGKKHSAETRRKMSESRTNYHANFKAR